MYKAVRSWPPEQDQFSDVWGRDKAPALWPNVAAPREGQQPQAFLRATQPRAQQAAPAQMCDQQPPAQVAAPARSAAPQHLPEPHLHLCDGA